MMNYTLGSDKALQKWVGVLQSFNKYLLSSEYMSGCISSPENIFYIKKKKKIPVLVNPVGQIRTKEKKNQNQGANCL